MEAFLGERRWIDGQPPILDQLVLTEFIAGGHFARYLRQMRRRYAARRHALLEALAEKLGDVLEVTLPEAGIHLVAWLPEGFDDRLVAERAASVGLEISSLRASASPHSRVEVWCSDLPGPSVTSCAREWNAWCGSCADAHLSIQSTSSQKIGPIS